MRIEIARHDKVVPAYRSVAGGRFEATEERFEDRSRAVGATLTTVEKYVLDSRLGEPYTNTTVGHHRGLATRYENGTLSVGTLDPPLAVAHWSMVIADQGNSCV